jgi:hypothetical protein
LYEYLLLTAGPDLAIVRKLKDWLVLILMVAWHQVPESVNFWCYDVTWLISVDVKLLKIGLPVAEMLSSQVWVRQGHARVGLRLAHVVPIE